jgi:hypothetical protein
VGKTYFIATKHSQFAEQEFESDATVIDPWRYIPEQAAGRVRRLGENKPPLISVLLPSRGRPDMLHRTIFTAFQTATHPHRIEFIVYLDEDDERLESYTMQIYFAVKVALQQQLRLLIRPRALLSECWNECAKVARGEILMHCGDDLTFDSYGWDGHVRQAFAETPDKILFAYGNDLGPHGETFGTHGFIHRRWVEAVGYFVPPLFSSDWNDVWLNEVAEMIDRKRLLPFVTEHHHYTFGKSVRDQTHADREERGERDQVVDLYQRTLGERKADAKKLKAAMV